MFVTDVMGENLIKYSEDRDGTVMYYDKDSIKKESGIVMVWTEDKYNGKNGRWSKWVKLCKENKNSHDLRQSRSLVNVNRSKRFEI